MQNLNIENDRNEQERDGSFERLVDDVGLYRAIQVRARNGLLRREDVNRLKFRSAETMHRKPEINDRFKAWLRDRMLVTAETFHDGYALYRLPPEFEPEREVGWQLMLQKGSFSDWNSTIEQVRYHQTRNETEAGKRLDAAALKARTYQDWNALIEKALGDRKRLYLERARQTAGTTKEIMHEIERQPFHIEQRTELMLRAMSVAKSLDDWMAIRKHASRDGEFYRLAETKIRQMAVEPNDIIKAAGEFERTSTQHTWTLKAFETAEAPFDTWLELTHIVHPNCHGWDMYQALLNKLYEGADTFERWHRLYERFCKGDSCPQEIRNRVWQGLQEAAATFADWRWILGIVSRSPNHSPIKERALQEMRRLGTRWDWAEALETVHEGWYNTEVLEPALDCLAALDREAHARRNQTATQEDDTGTGIVFD